MNHFINKSYIFFKGFCIVFNNEFFNILIGCLKINKQTYVLNAHSLRCILTNSKAGIAQLVERNLAKVEVASSNLVSRSTFKLFS